jgi:Leucine-rich repeat (LRR) protein
VILLLVIIAVSMVLINAYQARYARIGTTRLERDITSLNYARLPLENLEELKQFPQLAELDFRGTELSTHQYETLKSWFPDCTIFWEVPFQGSRLDPQMQELKIDTLSDEDLDLLRYFPSLERIDASACTDYARLTALRQKYPNLNVEYTLRLAGRNYAYTETALVLSMEDTAELFSLIPYFTQLESVTFVDTIPLPEQIYALREAYPKVSFAWNFTFKDFALDESIETLDLTGIPTTVEEIEAILPYLPNLTYVDMTDCGIDNEAMDALNARHENVKIVWTVTLGTWYRVKTDITWFMPVQNDYYPKFDELYNLRYCHDIIALDIGHRYVTTCDFVAYMPNLKYLLLADTAVSDLTPVSNCKELVYLELFLSHVRDLSPLLECTKLEDLNLHYTSTRDQAHVVAQMTWLKNVWWNHSPGSRLSRADQQMLKAALPECTFNFDCESSTGGGWRRLANYYAQRDIFGLYYMTG